MKPNIVLFHCHDLGRRLGCYGKRLDTPNIDSLAEDGVKFDNYFCTAAQCSPSRGSIMTGKYPHNHGLIGLAHKGFGWQLKINQKTLPVYMKEAGYKTHLFGLQHEASDPTSLGYEKIHRTGNQAEKVGRGLTKFFENQNQNTPFFISAGTFEPHRPFSEEEYSSNDLDEVKPLPYLPDKKGIREDIAGLNEKIYRVDETVGKVRKTLKENDLQDNTLFIFTTDHGIAMPRAKGTCYDPGIETALIMYKPREFENMDTQDELLSNVDLLPTILDYLNKDIPEDVDGKSFLSLLEKDDDYSPREKVFIEMTWHDKYNPMRGIRTNRYKYIKNFVEEPKVYLPLDIYTGTAGKEMKDEYYSEKRPTEELYDLEIDPLEKNNLTENPEYEDVLASLGKKVEKWMEKTQDILLKGPVPPTSQQLETIEDDPNLTNAYRKRKTESKSE
ncbi:hypothetical protein AKJ65_03350 [candidate division MSBL1 archaeon SCGC-AAA259E19]|uniref:Sulfatase N-terminal domain-containing protein n=1 Tax=candidate division MSBL1 archaeon SCGC-AAA259E19 TaxID=1698264 RepID=A0A133UKS5_9EURY|nr:hypothetical protein AKJ65_03350 [candidate division MSBL1 archaeon SCGC-AAA259E19]